jgi:hypothetical protein
VNAQDRANLIQKFLEEHSSGVMESKGSAYSRGEENSNSNFYRVAEALGTDPMSVAWTYALKHIDALSAYIKGGSEGRLIGSEPVEGRIGDAVNYLLILYSILVQEGILEVVDKVRPPLVLDIDGPVSDYIPLKDIRPGDRIRYPNGRTYVAIEAPTQRHGWTWKVE